MATSSSSSLSSLQLQDILSPSGASGGRPLQSVTSAVVGATGRQRNASIGGSSSEPESDVRNDAVSDVGDLGDTDNAILTGSGSGKSSDDTISRHQSCLERSLAAFPNADSLSEGEVRQDAGMANKSGPIGNQSTECTVGRNAVGSEYHRQGQYVNGVASAHTAVGPTGRSITPPPLSPLSSSPSSTSSLLTSRSYDMAMSDSGLSSKSPHSGGVGGGGGGGSSGSGDGCFTQRANRQQPPQCPTTAIATTASGHYLPKKQTHSSTQFQELPKRTAASRTASHRLHTTAPSQFLSGATATSTVACDTTGTDASMTAWHTWLVRKAQEQRDDVETQKQQERVHKEKVKVEHQIVARQHEKAELAWREWCSAKRRQERAKHENIRKQEQEERQNRDQKQQVVREKSQQAYNAWVHEKREEEKRQKLMEQQKLEQKMARDAVQQAHAKDAFESWRTSADQRLSKERRKEMFDVLRAPLSPTYCNPLAWKPIVEHKKSKRRK